MSKQTGKDLWANVATITITESAANTLTYKKLETGISLTEKVAWLINRIEYHQTNSFSSKFNTDADELHLGLAVANTQTNWAALAAHNDPTLVDRLTLTRVDLGAAASGFFQVKPLIHDMSTLPGGGIIVPPTPLYGFAQGNNLATATDNVIKIFYTLINLTVEEYWQLVEARRVISA